MDNTVKGVEIDSVREKLIELITDKENDLIRKIAWFTDTYRIKEVADHLIANGVTFATDNNVGSNWIPVTERLPEYGDTCLVVVKYKYDYEKEYDIDVDVAGYNPYDGYIDSWDTYNDWDEGQQDIHVTHWMPLPTAPEGE